MSGMTTQHFSKDKDVIWFYQKSPNRSEFEWCLAALAETYLHEPNKIYKIKIVTFRRKKENKN